MKKNTVRGIILLAVVAAVFSLIAFVLPVEKTVVFWIAYSCGLFALLFQLYIFKITFDGDAKSRFYGFPIARIGLFYLIIQLILSIVEILLASFIPVWMAVIVNTLLIGVAVIGCLTAVTIRDEVTRQDDRLKKSVSRIRELQSMTATMLAQCTDKEIKRTIKKIADELRFSDPISSDATDELEEEMHSQMSEIQQAQVDGDKEAIKTLSIKLIGTLTERNRLCSINK